MQDVVKVVPVCSTVFDVLQKLYVLIEGSPKRHSEYLSCLSDLRLENGPSVLQSLSATRWSARCVNLRIVYRCLPAIKRFLEDQETRDARGMLAVVNGAQFSFGLQFLRELFISVNATSEALQASETDLAAAATAIASLRSNVAAMRNTANEFERLYNAADIDTRVSQSQPSKRIRTVPSNLTNFVTDRFLTNSADAVSTANVAERTKQQLKLDFFIPVLDAVLL